MRILLSLILVLFFVSCSSRKQSIGNFTEKEASEIAITLLLNQQVTEWNNGNLDGFMEAYWKSDSLLFVTATSTRKGWQSVYNSYQKNYFDSESSRGNLRFELLEFQPLNHQNSEILVLGKWEVSKEEKVSSGKFSLILKQIEGKWRIIVDHTW